ncbi:MAG: tRNA (adenosine(37)-N6)-dimethylallyltransferase MiaA [Candidatus Pacebacteria bacterium]|nr:tRNA (adenosine(37)-N6)-dimethylallyltransferase MiaA [Candidatus Paceibacterota bacterium]
MKRKRKTDKKLVVIVGPTASGKTGLAVKLAKKFKGEVVCADSRQIYSGMKIGTAQPDKREKAGVPHRLFGIIPPKKVFSAAAYQKMALKTVKDIQKQGKMPFLTGGSAFYIYPVIEGWQFPKSKADPVLRKKLESMSLARLFQMLRGLDKKRAENIDKKNKRRLIRAVEIAKRFGKVPEITKKPVFDCLILGIDPGKDELKKRIEKRTERMLKQGLEKEVKSLVKKYGWTDVLKNTIGYAEFAQGPAFPLQELIALHTEQFAKRQMVWFKKDKRIHWLKNQKQANTLIKKFTEIFSL